MHAPSITGFCIHRSSSLRRHRPCGHGDSLEVVHLLDSSQAEEDTQRGGSLVEAGMLRGEGGSPAEAGMSLADILPLEGTQQEAELPRAPGRRRRGTWRKLASPEWLPVPRPS